MHAPGMEPQCILTGCVRGQVTTRGGSPATLLTRYVYAPSQMLLRLCLRLCLRHFAARPSHTSVGGPKGLRDKAQAPPSFVRADTQTEAVQCAMQRVWRHLHAPAALLSPSPLSSLFRTALQARPLFNEWLDMINETRLHDTRTPPPVHAAQSAVCSKSGDLQFCTILFCLRAGVVSPRAPHCIAPQACWASQPSPSPSTSPPPR
jgi:hypothetical protein